MQDVDRLVCLAGELELIGSSCVQDMPDLIAASIVSDTGLERLCRSTGRVVLRCGDDPIDLIGDIGVVVGSREDGGLWNYEVFRTLADGDRVRARGMLRRRPRPPQGGYRGTAHGYVLEAFGGLETIDIACEKRPRSMPASMLELLVAATESFVKPQRYRHTPSTPGRPFRSPGTDEV